MSSILYHGTKYYSLLCRRKFDDEFGAFALPASTDFMRQICYVVIARTCFCTPRRVFASSDPIFCTMLCVSMHAIFSVRTIDGAGSPAALRSATTMSCGHFVRSELVIIRIQHTEKSSTVHGPLYINAGRTLAFSPSANGNIVTMTSPC